MVTERHVVACFLAARGRILLLRRSNQVGNYQGRWAGVSGTVKDDPLTQAVREIHEETGYVPADIQLVRRGTPIEVVDNSKQMRWQVHPFLFRIEDPSQVILSWEHSEFRWIDPRQLDQYNTVPMLAEALSRAWDVGELGPARGVMQSSDFLEHAPPAYGSPAAPPAWPEAARAPANATPRQPWGIPAARPGLNAAAAHSASVQTAAALGSTRVEPAGSSASSAPLLSAPTLSAALRAPAGSPAPGGLSANIRTSNGYASTETGFQYVSQSALPVAAAEMTSRSSPGGSASGAASPSDWETSRESAPSPAPSGKRTGTGKARGPKSPAPPAALDAPPPSSSGHAPRLPPETPALGEGHRRPASHVPDPSLFASQGLPALGIPSFNSMDSMLSARGMPLNGTDPDWSRRAQEDDSLDGELIPDEEIEAGAPPPSAHASAAVRVKIMKTGEFPNPNLLATEAGLETAPPGSTGPELLEDPLLGQALSALRDDRMHGSTILVRRALDALRLAGARSVAQYHADWYDDLRMVAHALTTVRPSMASIPFAVAQVLYDLESEIGRVDDRHELRALLHRSIDKFLEQEQIDENRLIHEVSNLIPPGGTVFTVGHSRVVIEGLNHCKHFGIRVIVPEGRPLYEGRLTARAILAMGKSATVITDAAIGLHMREADLVIMGAEGLLSDGSVVYRTGAYLMALAARAAKVPVYVAATLTKLDLRPDALQHVVLEEKESDEVWTEAIPGLDVRNVYFEQIPSELITGIVTENGLFEPSAMGWEVQARDYLLEALTGIKG